MFVCFDSVTNTVVTQVFACCLNTQFAAFVTNVVVSTVSVAELTAVAVSGDVAIAVVAALLVDHFHVLMVQYAVFCVAPD